MTIEQVAARLGVTVAHARTTARRVYRTSRPRVYTDRHVRVLRWAVDMEKETTG